MIGFLLRKTLYDLWDNMFKIVVVNIGFIVTAAFPVFIPQLAGEFFNSFPLMISLTAFGILLCCVYLAAAAMYISSFSDYNAQGLGEIFKYFKHAWRPGLVMGVFVFVIFIVVTVIIPFYLGIESPVGLALAALIFWVLIFALLSFQFYYSVYSRLGKKVFKSLRKCMIISLDNSIFSIFLLLVNIVALVISVLFVFMFPGPAGIMLYVDEALRLRLLKYDWIEENPNENRKKIPWDALLIEEREKTGVRSFRNFIFPWKD